LAESAAGSTFRHRLPEARRAEVERQGRPEPDISLSSPQGNESMSIAATTDIEITPARPLLVPLLSAAACAALADWLFWGWTVLGVSLALFLGVLGVVAISINRTRAPRNTQIVMSAVFVAGLLAVVEDSNDLSQTVAELATALFVIVTTARQASSWQRDLLEAVTTAFRGPFQLIGDLFGALRHMKRRTPGWLGWLVAWIVPLGVFAVFLALFSSANPLIEHRLMQIDFRALFDLLVSQRTVFWGLVACVVWPLLRRRIRRTPAPKQEHRTVAAEPADLDYLLGVQAVLRALILFNVLFALQTGLNLTYLWGGASLPDGMSHAEYAHRGAYPLVVTALLAAGFVLIAMRPNGPAEHSRLIRPLGSAVDRAEHPSRDLGNLPARSVCRRFLVDVYAVGRLYMDGADRHRPCADPRPDRTQKIEFLVAIRQCPFTRARNLRLLLYQRAVARGVLQRGTFA
jgi:hypothetical protein